MTSSIGKAARFIGVRPAGASSGPRIPRALFIPLAATLILFCANNAAGSSITSILIAAKWLPLFAVFLVAPGMMRKLHTPSMPVVTVIPLAILTGIALLGSLLGDDVMRGVFGIISVVVAGIFGYFVSAIIVATNSRRALFELVANIARVVIVSATLFYIARIDLGRGGGFAAWMDNPNTLALILAPGMVIFMAGCIERRPGWFIWHAAFLIVGAAIIWTTNARSTILWMAFSGVAFWIYRRGPAFTSIALLAALATVLMWWEPIRDFTVDTLGLNWSARNVGISPLSGREEVWRLGWDLFLKRPVQGYGFGTTQELIRAESWRFTQFQGGHFHNSYIEALVEVGLIGLLAFVSFLFITVGRGIADAARTRVLPAESWPLAAIPFAILVGAMGHALFETWLLAAGNADAPLFWTCAFLIYHQAQIPIRAVRVARRRPPPARDGYRMPLAR